MTDLCRECELIVLLWADGRDLMCWDPNWEDDCACGCNAKWTEGRISPSAKALMYARTHDLHLRRLGKGP